MLHCIIAVTSTHFALAWPVSSTPITTLEQEMAEHVASLHELAQCTLKQIYTAPVPPEGDLRDGAKAG